MFGSTTKDPEDAVTLDELRGALTKGEKVTVEGLFQEMQVVKQQLANHTEQFNKLIGLVMTLQGQYEALQAARARELQDRGTGPTVNADDQPSD